MTDDNAPQIIDSDRTEPWCTDKNELSVAILFNELLQQESFKDQLSKAIHHVYKTHEINPSVYRMITAHIANTLADHTNGDLHSHVFSLTLDDDFWGS